jgi:hypothetical protein
VDVLQHTVKQKAAEQPQHLNRERFLTQVLKFLQKHQGMGKHSSKTFDVDGIRHIFQPIINYVYVPSLSTIPPELPQFDYEVYGYRPLPIDFPDYNSIDSIDSQNVFRFSLWNKLQTKRKGEIDDLVDWQVFTDWRLNPRPGQGTFSDVFSQWTFRPRTYISLSQEARYNINNEYLSEINHRLTLRPNNVWSIG